MMLILLLNQQYNRIFHYLPAYEPVLWDHRTGWLGIVLYLAGTSDLNDLLDV